MGQRTPVASRSKEKEISRSKSVERKKKSRFWILFLFIFLVVLSVRFASHKLHAGNIRRFFRATYYNHRGTFVSYGHVSVSDSEEEDCWQQFDDDAPLHSIY